MDILCKHCGEPWDVYELHDSENYTFDQARRLFYQYGCGAFDAIYDGLEPTVCKHGPCESADKLAAIDMLQDLLGDDIDGLASMSDDLDALLG